MQEADFQVSGQPRLTITRQNALDNNRSVMLFVQSVALNAAHLRLHL
jgi:hypothetical protein